MLLLPEPAPMPPNLFFRKGPSSWGPLHSLNFSKLNFLTFLGYLSYRHDEKGSGFIQTLTDVFMHKIGPITELIEEVSQMMHLGTPPRLKPPTLPLCSYLHTYILGLLTTYGNDFF